MKESGMKFIIILILILITFIIIVLNITFIDRDSYSNIEAKKRIEERMNNYYSHGFK